MFIVGYLANKQWGFGIHQTAGPSMRPTIDNHIVVVDKFTFRVLKMPPKKGDVVVAAAPSESEAEVLKMVCKRVAAVEGESVSWITKGKMAKEVVPAGHVWLLGDSPDVSVDSRSYGPLPVSNVKAKVIMTIYPEFKLLI